MSIIKFIETNLSRKKNYITFYKYIFNGLIISIFYLFLIKIFEYSKFEETINIVLSRILTFLFAYLIHNYFTFNLKKISKKNFSKFILSRIFIILLTLIITKIFLSFGFSLLLSSIICLILISIISFLINLKFVFKF